MVEIVRNAKFSIGGVVRHRLHPFRGVIFDVDPTFSNSEEWWLSIPEELRPKKDQPFYHLLAEKEDISNVAFVSEQNLLVDETVEPVYHSVLESYFYDFSDVYYHLRQDGSH